MSRIETKRGIITIKSGGGGSAGTTEESVAVDVKTAIVETLIRVEGGSET
jgi:hypothetical protein